MSSRLSNQRVCVTGGAGFLGRAVCAELCKRGVGNIFVPRSREYDVTQADDVARMFDHAKPHIIIHLAARVGGIGANQRQPGLFFHANMAMGLHLIEEARKRGIEKFIQVGTVCSYPRDCVVPFHEDALWDGYPDETNAPYGIAKRAISVMLDAYRRQYGMNGVYLIPVNLYGPGDSFDPEDSHVIPGLIRKFCDAVDQRRDAVTCWGSGGVTREFLYVDDAAEAICLATERYDNSAPINLGSGREITIVNLAQRIADLCGFHGRIVWDRDRPDGQPRRCLDTSRAKAVLDWQAKTDLEDGLRRTIDWWRSRRLSEPRPA